MIYWELFTGFLCVGCFAFGGAYGAIPLIRDVVLSHSWLTEEQLAYMIAVSESTPGPIMVNLATFVGTQKAGVLGGLLATLAVVLPSFFIILLITAIMKRVLKNPYVQATLRGLKPCIIGMVLATGIYMTAEHCFTQSASFVIEPKAVILTVLLAGLMFGLKPVLGKKPSPIQLIIIAALLGMGIYGL